MNERLHAKLRLLPLLSLAAVAAVGCSSSGDDESAGSGEPVKLAAAFDLRSDVKTIDAAKWDSLRVAHDGAGIWLKPEAKGEAFLAPGTVTLVKGRGVLRAGAVKEEGDHLVVENTLRGFADFIESGTIDLAGATRFDQPFEDERADVELRSNEAPSEEATPPAGQTKTQSIHPLADQEPPPSEPTKEGTVFDKPGKTLVKNATDFLSDGWTVKKQVKGDGDHLYYDIELTKSSGGILARLHATGTIDNLATGFHVAVQNRTTTHHTYDVKTSGEADLTWEVGITEGAKGYNKLLFPGVAWRQPFLAGDVPMVLKVKSSFALILAATGKNSTTTGKVHVKWTNDGGIKVTKGEGTTNASGTGDASYSEERGTLAVGPSSFGILATLPRVELGVGLDEFFVVGSHFTNMSTSYVNARGALGGSVCANIDTKLEGRVGVFVDSEVASMLLKGLDITDNKLSKQLYDVNRSHVTCGLK